MAELKYEPVSHDYKAFLKNARKREGFRKAYNDLAEEYTLFARCFQRVQSRAAYRLVPGSRTAIPWASEMVAFANSEGEAIFIGVADDRYEADG